MTKVGKVDTSDVMGHRFPECAFATAVLDQNIISQLWSTENDTRYLPISFQNMKITNILPHIFAMYDKTSKAFLSKSVC